MVANVNQLIKKYGYKWLIINQLLVWIGYFVLYYLISSGYINAVEYLMKYPVFDKILGMLGLFFSRILIAYLINRVGAIPRIYLTNYLVVFLFQNPVEDQEDFPGVEEAKKDK